MRSDEESVLRDIARAVKQHTNVSLFDVLKAIMARTTEPAPFHHKTDGVDLLLIHIILLDALKQDR